MRVTPQDDPVPRRDEPGRRFARRGQASSERKYQHQWHLTTSSRPGTHSPSPAHIVDAYLPALRSPYVRHRNRIKGVCLRRSWPHQASRPIREPDDLMVVPIDREGTCGRDDGVADLSIGMVMLHVFTFVPGWVRLPATRAATRRPRYLNPFSRSHAARARRSPASGITVKCGLRISTHVAAGALPATATTSDEARTQAPKRACWHDALRKRGRLAR